MLWALATKSGALGQLGQDEPASGMVLEPLVAFAPISGSVAIAIHHRNSDDGGEGESVAAEGDVGMVDGDGGGFKPQEVEIESIRKKLARAADTGYRMWHNV